MMRPRVYTSKTLLCVLRGRGFRTAPTAFPCPKNCPPNIEHGSFSSMISRDFAPFRRTRRSGGRRGRIPSRRTNLERPLRFCLKTPNRLSTQHKTPRREKQHDFQGGSSPQCLDTFQSSTTEHRMGTWTPQTISATPSHLCHQQPCPVVKDLRRGRVVETDGLLKEVDGSKVEGVSFLEFALLGRVRQGRIRKYEGNAGQTQWVPIIGLQVST